MVNRLLRALAGLDRPLLHLVTFVLAFGESAVLADLVVPGEVGMVVAGAAGRRGDHPLPTLVLAAAVGSTLGDLASYLLGRRVGRGLIERWPVARRHLLPRAERAQAWFDRRGGTAVFLARWVGALRALVPLVAGTARMPAGRFIAWSASAAVLWSATVVTLGYHFGGAIADAVDRAGGWISFAALAALAAWWLARRARTGAASSERRRFG